MYPSTGGQHHKSSNLEGRIQFMILKINIPGADVTKKETNYFNGV